VKELTLVARGAEGGGESAFASRRREAGAEEARETSRLREKGEGVERIFAKSCWGLEGLGKALHLAQLSWTSPRKADLRISLIWTLPLSSEALGKLPAVIHL